MGDRCSARPFAFCKIEARRRRGCTTHCAAHETVQRCSSIAWRRTGAAEAELRLITDNIQAPMKLTAGTGAALLPYGLDQNEISCRTALRRNHCVEINRQLEFEIVTDIQVTAVGVTTS